MDNNKLQNKIGEILDFYNLRNISQLEKKLKELKDNNQDVNEIKLIEFVIDVYNLSI